MLSPAIVTALDAVWAGATADSVETETLELKQQPAGPLKGIWRLLADAALCFANHLGGTVIIGVSDRVPGPAAFAGSELDPDTVKRRVWELTEPRLVVSVEQAQYRGVGLVVIDVPQSPDIHADTKGSAPRRIGTSCIPMTPREQDHLRDEKQGIDWSAQPSRRSTGAISPRALEAVRERLRRYPDARAALSRFADEELVSALGLTARPGMLNRAGARLLTAPAESDPQVVYQFRPTPGSEPVAVVRLAEPLVVAYERVLELVEARNDAITVQLERGAQVEIFDFPPLAIEEAVANALIHRDFRLRGPVVVDHSPQVLSITSPGPLVYGVTRENILTHRSKPRNPALTSAARLMRLAEEVGQGVDRMYRATISSGRTIPTIESGLDSVVVAFAGGAPNRRLVTFVAEYLPAEEQQDVDTLLTLATLLTQRTIEAGRLAPIVQKSVAATETVLRRLADEQTGFIEPTRGTHRKTNPRYRLRTEALQALGPAVAYNRRTEDEIDRKVIGHVREYGRIKNKTARDLFDVDVQKAKEILSDLVSRGILTKSGQGQRGPGVEYVAGPSFPATRRATPRLD